MKIILIIDDEKDIRFLLSTILVDEGYETLEAGTVEEAEGIIGNKMQLPIVAAYGKILGRLGKTFGWLMIGAVATIGGFYTVLTGYSIAYTYFAATLQIPENTADFFKYTFLQDSGSLSNIGSISWPIVIVTLVCALFSWVVLIRNIRSGIEKICSLFMPILMVFILFFALSTTSTI